MKGDFPKTVPMEGGTIDQQGAIAVFESLGFRSEGLLREHVRTASASGTISSF